MSSKNNHANALNEILKNKIPNIDNRGIFKEWTYLVKCKDTWEILADEYFSELQPKMRPNPDNTNAEKIMHMNCMILTSHLGLRPGKSFFKTNMQPGKKTENTAACLH